MKEVQSTTFLKIDEVLETRPSTSRLGETDLKVKYSEFVPQDDVRRAELFKNLSTTRTCGNQERGRRICRVALVPSFNDGSNPSSHHGRQRSSVDRLRSSVER